MPKREENEINIMVLLRALLKRVWLVILATVLGAALLFTYSKFFVTPMYASTAKLYVNNRKNDATNSGYITDAEISASKKLVDTYLTILKTPDTLDMVIESAGIDCTSGQLMNMISAGSVNSTEIFYITVTASNPDLAQRVAQKIVDILPQRISDVIEGSSVKIIQEPRVPSSKSSPNIANYTLI